MAVDREYVYVEIGDGRYARYAEVYCPACVAKRKRADQGKPEPPVEIPGQLAIDSRTGPDDGPGEVISCG